ncbi:hypothetical protein EFN57_07575 [Leuconostoc citreum]|uniref:hypothetical protein n=1 Tax=Leuconostoc citreum TaxID=33964 RepID=UPI0021A436A5|nr:hypothetical protein [Leuconostoc citreum]MCT3055519.1 hypothetical protein [Leuconostoc citreum]MCT3062809.1 hypothetical protein [Leuconostoc citreum]
MFNSITNYVYHEDCAKKKSPSIWSIIILFISSTAAVFSIVNYCWTINNKAYYDKIDQASKISAWLYSSPRLPNTSTGSINVVASTTSSSKEIKFDTFKINNTSSTPIYKVLIFVAPLKNDVNNVNSEIPVKNYIPRYISTINPGEAIVDINRTINNKDMNYGVSLFFCDTNQNYWLRSQYGKLISTTKKEISEFINNNNLIIRENNAYTKKTASDH